MRDNCLRIINSRIVSANILSEEEIKFIEGIERGIPTRKAYRRIVILTAIVTASALAFGFFKLTDYLLDHPEMIDLEILLFTGAAMSFGFLIGLAGKEFFDAIFELTEIGSRLKSHQLLVRLYRQRNPRIAQQTELPNA